MQKTVDRGANALKQELVVRVEVESAATPDAVYAVLADLSSHLVWAGEQQGKRTRLLSMESPPGQAAVGTEFRSSGADPMGSFSDRSVVTEASPGRAFEFVTEALLTTKRGKTSAWTSVERYDLEETSRGCLIVATSRVSRISALPGTLRVFNIAPLRGLALAASAKVSRRSVINLARLAEQRSIEGR